MGCAGSSDAEPELQAKQSKNVYDVSSQQLSVLPPPQSAVGTKVIKANDNLLSRLPDLGSSKIYVAVEMVEFRSNRFTKIPEQLKGLPKLTSIDFSANPFARSGAFDALLHLPKLSTLTLRDAKIKQVPAALLASRSIVSLDLSANPSLVLSGKGAPDFGRMLQLRTLKLRNCELVGEVPSSIRNAKLTSLDLSANPRLDLSDAKGWGVLKKSLHELVLEDLALFALPRGVCSCTALRSLSLRGNRTLESLAGIIFMTELTELDLSNCGLRSLPAELDTAEKLSCLRMSNHRLSADAGHPLNSWRAPPMSHLLQLTALRSLTLVDACAGGVSRVDTALLSAIAQSSRNLTDVSFAKGHNGVPLCLLGAADLTQVNELPSPEGSTAMERLRAQTKQTPSDTVLRPEPTAFVTAADDACPVSSLLHWLIAINEARNSLNLLWPVAVLRYRAFVDSLPVASTSLEASRNATVPLDVAAVHLGLHLQFLHSSTGGEADPPAAAYITRAGPPTESGPDTALWDAVVDTAALPKVLKAHGVLGQRNPLDNVGELPELDAAEDQARELVLRLSAHAAEAHDHNFQLTAPVHEYMRLLALPLSPRYLPLSTQLTALAHFVASPTLFLQDIATLFPDEATDLTSAVRLFTTNGALFEVSDAVLGRTTTSWDAEFGEHCPWLGQVGRGRVAWGELLQ